MIYLDNAATTPIFPEVIDVITEQLQSMYLNPSAIYQGGKKAKRLITNARREIAEIYGIEPKQLYFTSGASEANNWAIKNLALNSQVNGEGNHLVATMIEHPSVHDVLTYLETKGFEVTYLLPNEEGIIDAQQFIQATTDQTIGWVAITVNNETGTQLPIETIAEAANERELWLHVDAVQVQPHQVKELLSFPVTTLVGSAHKFNGPKGIGYLIQQNDHRSQNLTPFIHGGGQEMGLRSGTENVPYIVGMAKAITLSNQQGYSKMRQCEQLTDYLYQSLRQAGVTYERNGSQEVSHQVNYIHNIWLKDQDASQLLIRADLAGIAISAGSACSAGSLQPSRILQAFYPDQPERWNQSVRLSFGYQTTTADIDAFITLLTN